MTARWRSSKPCPIGVGVVFLQGFHHSQALEPGGSRRRVNLKGISYRLKDRDLRRVPTDDAA